MNKYTIAERQAIKDRLADEKCFERDRELFASLFPHNALMSELARVNNVNRQSLCRRMIYLLLTKTDEAHILEWRESGARVAAAPKQIITGPGASSQRNGRSGLRLEGENAAPAAPARKRNLKAEEFPRIDWANNENEDIQLAILLYDERVNTWQKLCALRAEIDSCPEKALAIADLDDRNRLAHHELEVFQDTGVFPCKHPLAVAFMADRKQVANIEHNIGRYKSELKKKDLSPAQKERANRNLANAFRLNDLMQRLLNE